MKASIVHKKMKQIKSLLNESYTLEATVKHMEKHIKEAGALGMDMTLGTYLNNMKRRLTKIEESFDKILK